MQRSDKYQVQQMGLASNSFSPNESMSTEKSRDTEDNGTSKQMTQVGVENKSFYEDVQTETVVKPAKEELQNGGPQADGNTGMCETNVDVDADPEPGPAVDAPVSFDPKKRPLLYCKFIVKHYKLAFALTLSGHLIFLVASGIMILAGYSLFPTDFQGVPLNMNNDDTFLREVAWSYRDEDESILKVNTSAEMVGARTKNGDILQIFYQGANVLTKENLQAIKDLEEQMTSKPEWLKFCKQDVKNLQAGCSKPSSLIRFFDGSFHPSLNDPTFSNISGILYTALNIPLLNRTLQALVGTEAVITPTEASTTITRTLFFTGLPLEGYNLTTDSVSDQMTLIQTFLVDNFRSRLYELLDDGLNGMTVNFIARQLLMHDIFDQVIYDLLLAVGSFLFIFIFMLVQTNSLFLTSFSIFSILTSFLGANIVYRVILDYRYFGIFHVLSIFIILGIGADNIFVFNDTWRATAHEKHASMEERLSSCYRRASKSMMITSLTTFVAFVSNAFSPLLLISSFGVFSSVLVVVNFFSAIVFFPTCVILHHKKWERWSWPCLRAFRNCSMYPCAKKDESKTGHRPNMVVRFFRGPYHAAVTHRVGRWLFIGVCLAIIAASLYFVTELKMSEKKTQLYKNGHNYYESEQINNYAFKSSLDDKNIKVIIAFGLKNQDMSGCHKTDYKCKGKTVWDNSFDLNPKPAQLALLKLCERIRSTSNNDLLYLKRDPVTNLVDMDCFITQMNEFMRNESPVTTPYGTTNLSLPTSEIKYAPFFSAHRSLYNASFIDENFYRYFETIKSYWINNRYNGTLTHEYGTYSILLGESKDARDTSTILSKPGAYYGTRLRYAGIEIRTTLTAGTKDFQAGLDIYNAWEKFVSDEVSQMPPSLQGGIQLTPAASSNEWHEFKRQEALAKSALQGIIIGLCLAFFVLTLATTNVIISTLATITIVLVTVTIAGCIPLFGWKISVIESINLSLVVGLAVDYVVHLSESYHNSPQKTRQAKVRDMLESMGVSVVSGAISTLGAAAFMIGAQIQFFLQFGIFMFCTIGFSLIYSLCLFTPALALMGPEEHCGSLVPLVRWVWYKIIGRGKEDTQCKDCHGKGFVKHSKD
ncbi:protein dispatched homolog 3-like isoform X1 [Biomphalaria glabrata]|uniref:Protein dispatched homolog 3-like isoform X1 n=2 Tax=Biomphalaria glabrata TaxID=6526 RepID=A0A9W2ZZE2_BIOGL|nr:protein dispatched homolog 3-like isoform X1 [Biomphalaria glabrata]